MKLLVQVEAALNSAEAAEIAAQWDPAVAARYMEEAGLRMLPEPPPPLPTEGGISSTNGSVSSVPEDIVAKDQITGSTRAYGTDGEVSVSENVKERKTGGKIGAAGGIRKATEKGNRRGARRSAAGVATAMEGREGVEGDGKTRKRDGGSNRKRKGGGDKGKVKGSSSLGGAEGVGEPLEPFIARVLGGCEVQCLLMVDECDERLVVAVGDALTGEALLGCLFEEPAVVQLASHGLMQETACVNRAAFQVR